jgi:hypothetical protein
VLSTVIADKAIAATMIGQALTGVAFIREVLTGAVTTPVIARETMAAVMIS